MKLMGKTQPVILALLGCAVVLLLAACGGVPQPVPDLEVSFSAAPLGTGDGSWELSWESNADSVLLAGEAVEASSSTAVRVESVTEFDLVASIGDQTRSLDVTLAPVSAVTVTADSELTGAPGATFSLSAEVLAEGSEVEPLQAVDWSSSDTSVATVTADGLVSLVGFGTAEITAVSLQSESVSGSVSVTGALLPTITEFIAEPWPGEQGSWRLSWTAAAAEVLLDGDVVAGSGFTFVEPAELHDYVLLARNGSDEVSRTLALAPVSVALFDVQEELVGAPGASFQLQASVLADGSSVDPLLGVTWHSSDSTVAVVDSDGLVVIRGFGTAEITARSVQSGAVSQPVTVRGALTPVIGDFVVEPWLGEEGDWRISWDVSAERVELAGDSVENEGFAFVSPGEATSYELVAWNGEERDARDVTLAPVSGLAILGITEPFTAEPGSALTLQAVVEADGSDVEPAQDVDWSSSDEAVAVVAPDGTVTVVGFGTADIGATSVQSPVVSSSVQVTSARVPVIESFVATPLNDGSGSWELSWQVDAAQATLDGDAVDSAGAAIVAPDEAHTFELVARNGADEVSQSLTIAPVSRVTVSTPGGQPVRLEPGETVKLSANVEASGSDAEPSQEVNWESSNEAVATVDTDGTVTIVNLGTATITAVSRQSGEVQATVSVTGVRFEVIDSFTASPWLGEGGEWQLSWDVDSNDVTLDGVPVEPVGTRLTTPDGVHEYELRASTGDGFESAELVLAPISGLTLTTDEDETTVAPGSDIEFTAAVEAAGSLVAASQEVSWSSSNTGVATVNGDGLVTVIGFGSAVITARSDQAPGINDSVTVTGKLEPVINSFTAEPWVGDEGEWRLAWDASAAAVGLNGSPFDAIDSTFVSPTSRRSFVLTARNGDDEVLETISLAPVSSITISGATGPIVGTIGTTVGLTAEVSAAGSDVEPSQEVMWSSSDDDIATVDEDGLVSITGLGVAEISVSSNQAPGIVEGIEVIGAEVAAVTEFMAVPLVDGSGAWQLSWRATGHSIELDGVAVDEIGTDEVNPSDTESFELVATTGTDSDSMSLTLAPISGVVITSDSDSNEVEPGQTIQLSAEVVAAGSETEPSQQVSWTSTDDSFATVDSNGLVTVIGFGSTTITATSQQLDTAQATVTVSGAREPVITEFSATALLNDDNSWRLTWDVDAEQVTLGGLDVDSSGSRDVSPTERHEYQLVGRNGDDTIADTITLAPVSAVDISTNAEELEVAPNTDVQFSATVLAAGSDVEPSQSVTWHSSNEDVATVSASGLVTVIGFGDADITATSYQAGVTSAAVTVSGVRDPVITSFTAEPLLDGEGTWRLSWDVDAAVVELNDVDVTELDPPELPVTQTEATIYTLMVRNGASSASQAITLAPVSSIELAEEATGVRLLPGGSIDLSEAVSVLAEGSDVEPSQDVTWSSDDEGVSIDGGVITVTEDADATVTVQVTSSQDESVTADIQIEVLETAISNLTTTAELPLQAGDELELSWLNEGAATLRLNTIVTGGLVATSEDLDPLAEQATVQVPEHKGFVNFELEWTHPDGQEHSLSLWSEQQSVRGWVCVDGGDVITIEDSLLDTHVKSLYGVAANADLTCADVHPTDWEPQIVNGQETRNLIMLNRCNDDAEPDPELELVESLEGIQHLTDLYRLELECNELEDISLLRHLSGLVDLNLDNNNISDLSPLADMTQLEALGLYNNEVVDLAPLAGLTNLDVLYLSANRIKNVSPLAGLTQVRVLWLLLNCSEELVEGELYQDCLSDLSPLSGLVNLETLVFSGNAVTDISFINGDMDKLQHINASNNLIASIDNLADLPALRTVTVDGNLITSFAALADNPNFPAGDPYTYQRGTAGAYPGHHLAVGYNCFDPSDDDDIADMVADQVIVTGIDVATRLGEPACSATPPASSQMWLRLPGDQLVDPARLTFPGHGL